MCASRVDGGDHIKTRLLSSSVGGAEGSGTVGLHGLEPRGSKDTGAYTVPAGGQDPLSADARLGDTVILALLVRFTSSSQIDPTVEPPALGIGGDSLAFQRTSDLRGSGGGLGDDGDVVGDGELETQEAFGL